jgi:hypothetical protein
MTPTVNVREVTILAVFTFIKLSALQTSVLIETQCREGLWEW